MQSICYNSPIGPLLIVEHGRYIVEVSFMEADTRKKFRTGKGAVRALSDAPVAAACMKELEAYFAGELTAFTVPVRPVGTVFRQRVWDALMDIPYGETISYKQLAQNIGQPTAARAVGGANNNNPISIIIPCHRVIGAGGAMVGYGGGLDNKVFLLELEKRGRAR